MNLRINESLDGKTVLTVLRQELSLSQSEIRRLKENRIFVNDKPVTVRHVLQNGDLLELRICDKTSEHIAPVEMDLKILYEDDALLVVNKPSGMPVHPSQNNRNNSLANGIMFRFRDSPLVFRPVNRLDKFTSGPVIVAKTADICYKISLQFQNGMVKKQYVAVTQGIPSPATGTVSLPIGRQQGSVIKRAVTPDGKPAVTDYSVLATDEDFALVRLIPHTGRTHQLRVHMAALGCPLRDDFLYGSETPGKHFLLHCERLTFVHPATGVPLTIAVPPPFSFPDCCK